MPSAITNVDFFCSSLNPNGLFTMSFSSASARESYFSGIRISSMSITTGTYARKDGVLTVGVNETELNAKGVNYVRFQNAQFDNKWFYAFVRKIEYVNPKTSKLYIDTDVFMTYQFDITSPNEVFVERETVGLTEELLSDKNLLPEPVTCNGYMKRVLKEWGYDTSTLGAYLINFNFAVIVGTLSIEATDQNASAKLVLNNRGARYIDGSPLGGSLWVATSESDFKKLIECIVVCNGQIISTFAIPKNRTLDVQNPVNITYSTPDGSGTMITDTFTVYTLDPTNVPAADVYTATHPWLFSPWSDIYNYTVRNKKLFSYPYVFIAADNHSGTESVFRYDLFSGDIKFEYRYLAAPASCLSVLPKNYEGVTTADVCIVNNNTPQIPYSESEYGRFIAQHKNSLIFSAKETALNWGISFAKGIAKGNYEGAIEGTISTVEQLGGEIASLEDMKGIGHTSYNVPSGNLLGLLDELKISIYEKYVCIEDAKRIDSFFDRYGYRVDRIEELSWNRRTNYDYIKTSGCNVGGRIPADDKAKINSLFDTGITIWHTSAQYGKYATAGRENTPL